MDDNLYPTHDPNKKTAPQLWDERYSGPDYLYGKEPSSFVRSYASLLKQGKLIDIATGEGRNLAYLASLGFECEGIDCSPKGIEKTKKLLEEKKVKAEARIVNLDFFLMPLMKYDSVVMTYFRPMPRFFSEIRRGLVMNGTFLLEACTVEHYKNPKNQTNLDFDQCYKENEVLKLLKDFTVLYYKEMKEGDSVIVQALAQKKAV